jgi:glycerophosphoryl diester phosphodiesterase
VHGTVDGEVVVFHDATLDRVTDGRGALRERTLAELRSLDAGHGFVGSDGGHPFRGGGIGIPTLDEVLGSFPHTALNIEIKQLEPAIEREVMRLLDRHDARKRVLLAAEDQRVMDRIRAAVPDVLSGSSAEEVLRFFVSLADPAVVYDPPGAALQVPPVHEGIEVVTEAFVERAHACRTEVHVWTINAPGEVERLLDLGVDGIMTDYPTMAAEVFARRGLA